MVEEEKENINIQKRVRFAGQGKTINKSGKHVSGIKFDLNAVKLMTRYVLTDSDKIRRSQLIKMRNVIELMDINEYRTDPKMMNRINFIRKALYGRIELNLHDRDIIIRHVSGGLTEEDLQLPDDYLSPLNPGDIKWVEESMSACIKFSFIQEEIDQGLKLFNEFKSGDYKTKEDAIKKIENFNAELQNKFRKARIEAPHEEMMSLKDSVFGPMVKEAHLRSMNKDMNLLITGMQGFNRMLGGGFAGSRTYMLFGLPGEGKSMTMLDIAYQVKKFNKGFIHKDMTKRPCVVLLTMENSVRETVERLLSIVTKGRNISEFNIEQLESMLRGDGELYLSDDSPIDIIVKYMPQMSCDTSYLYTITEDLEDEGYEVIFMIQDYIKKIRSVSREEELRIELGAILDEMKIFANLKDIPVLTASQLNRDAIRCVDEHRKKNGADAVRLIGRNNIGESVLLLDNADAVYAISPTRLDYDPSKGTRYLGIHCLKNRFPIDSDAPRVIFQPYYDGSPSLVHDIGTIPAYVETTVNMQQAITPNPMKGQSPYSNRVAPNLRNLKPVEDMDTSSFIDEIMKGTMAPTNIEKIKQDEAKGISTSRTHNGFQNTEPIVPIIFTNRPPMHLAQELGFSATDNMNHLIQVVEFARPEQIVRKIEEPVMDTNQLIQVVEFIKPVQEDKKLITPITFTNSDERAV